MAPHTGLLTAAVQVRGLVRRYDERAVLDEGQIVAEESIDLAEPRSPADPRFAAVRSRLLDALGVSL